MPNVTSGDEFAQALNEFDVRVFPPKTQITPADIMPALNGVIQGDGYQQYAVAAALAEPINQLLKKSSRRGVGFMFRDPDSKKLHFLNQRIDHLLQNFLRPMFAFVQIYLQAQTLVFLLTISFNL